MRNFFLLTGSFIAVFWLTILALGLSADAQMRRPLVSGNVNVAATTGTSRYALPDQKVSECLIMSKVGNAGAVYVGDGTVTNAAGANPGVKLATGVLLNFPIQVNNSNWIYIAGDTLNDKVQFLCW